jgi:glycosyltransferase involved in cell wall biosynthesis
MPVFNRERFVAEAIESVLEQDFGDFELVIVDDGSTDRSPAILGEYAERDERIIVVTLPANQGIPAALNAGLARARAPYIARLDSDDLLMPGRLAAQAKVLDERDDVVLVTSAYELMTEDGRTTGIWRGDEPHEVVAYFLSFFNIVGGGGQVMFRRSAGEYSTAYPSSEDYELWVRLLRQGRIASVPLIGMRQREHGDRSLVKYREVKRANWTAIMRDSLGRYLDRPVLDEEIAALITLWRHDGARGRSSLAERPMREAFARFCRDHTDESLRRQVRERTARQWWEAAAVFAKAGHRVEALRYQTRAASWSPRTTLRLARWRTARPKLAHGLNIAGYVERSTGMGESARLCAKACAEAAIATVLIDVNSGVRPIAIHRASLFHINGDQLAHVHGEFRDLFESAAYRIAVWHWDLPQIPDQWVEASKLVNEIWAPTKFVHDAVALRVRVPVRHMPHGIETGEREACTPVELGVPPGRFTFLCLFDLLSVDRKNPLGAVDAFRRAFAGTGSTAALLIKASQADRHPAAFAELDERLRGIPNVHLTREMLSRPRLNGLIAASDAVVSLHRSEGFGLVLAEAMALGKPVVATGWSGPMDYLTAENSCPVRFELVPLEKPYRGSGAGQHWAEPDVEHAAYCMQRLVEDHAFRTQIGERAGETMRTRFSAKAAGERYRARLTNLGLLR